MCRTMKYMEDVVLENIENLYKMSDLSVAEYEELKERYLVHGQTENMQSALYGRCLLPKYRNLQRQQGEMYAPVTYTPDYMVKLVEKPTWGGWILAMTLWDMMVIDVDCMSSESIAETPYLCPEDLENSDELPNIESNIKRHYPDDLFYINKTNRGYHIYLVSRPLSYATEEAILMRIKLNGDPAHGSNSLYTGSSIRLSRKCTDPVGQLSPSRFLKSCGAGRANAHMQELYDTVQSYLLRYGSQQIDVANATHMSMLQGEWDKHLGRDRQDHGLTHIVATAPYLLVDKTPVKSAPFTLSPELTTHCVRVWKKTIKYKNVHACCGSESIADIVLWSHYNMCFNNLYRILESTADYAHGVHLQEHCHFISYRDLLVVDYDDPRRLQILHRFVKKNPLCTFRLVRTTKGYHAFLTSQPVHHRASLDMLLELRSDPLHMLSSFHRGYGVRVNQKDFAERPYKETYIMGKAPEDQRLVELYRKHLELYKHSCLNGVPIYNTQFYTTRQQLRDDTNDIKTTQ